LGQLFKVTVRRCARISNPCGRNSSTATSSTAFDQDSSRILILEFPFRILQHNLIIAPASLFLVPRVAFLSTENRLDPPSVNSPKRFIHLWFCDRCRSILSLCRPTQLRTRLRNPVPLLMGWFSQNRPQSSSARRCWARRSELLMARIVLRRW